MYTFKPVVKKENESPFYKSIYLEDKAYTDLELDLPNNLLFNQDQVCQATQENLETIW